MRTPGRIVAEWATPPEELDAYFPRFREATIFERTVLYNAVGILMLIAFGFIALDVIGVIK